MKEPQNHDEDAVECRKTNEKRFPIIGKLARGYLAVLHSKKKIDYFNYLC